MQPQDHHNYQPVMIKTLNHNNGEATRKQIRKELHNANPDLPKEKRFSAVFEALEKNGVAELRTKASDSKDDLYVLNAFKTYGDNPNKVGTITWYCDQKIGVSKDIEYLRSFEDKIGKTRVQVLEEILRLKGKDRTAEQLGWSSGGSGLLTSKRVDEPYFLHPLASSTYTPKDSDYAQAIFTSPKTKWGNEIDPTEETLKINFNYEKEDGEAQQHNISVI